MPQTIFFTFSLLFVFTLMGNSQEEYISLFDTEKSGHIGLEEGPSDDHLRATTLRLSKRVMKGNRLPSQLKLRLFDDAVIDISLDDPELSTYKDLLVYRGRSAKSGYKHLSHYRDLVIIVNPHNQHITAQLHIGEGNYQITPMPAEGIYRVVQTSTDPLECHSDELPMVSEEKVRDKKNNDGCEEQDADGKYVADLFVGYSYAAAARVMDIDAHALSLVEMVNNGLVNSLVDNIYVRLVGTGLNPENPGVVTSVLGDVYDWYEEEIIATGADYIAAVQVPTGGHNEAGGWAGVGGYSSVNSVNNAAAVFRHEIGHNMGSSHCEPGIRPYAAGYNNGTSRTHMCGNNVNFYSTPLVTDDNGLILGDAATADNARLWRERASVVSARRLHTIKYDEDEISCDAETVDNGRYHIINVNSGKYLATDNGSTSRGTIVTQAATPANSNEWDLINVVNGHNIKHVVSGYNIDVPGSSSSLGTNMLIWSSHSGQNQVFDFIEITPDTFEIKAFNGLCLQIKDIGTVEGDTIIQDVCDASYNNRWILAPIAGGSDFKVVVSTTDVNCYGSATGSASVTASGGSGIYSYSWSDGQTDAIATGLTPGMYTVAVSDGSESISRSVSIRQAARMEVSASIVAGDTNTPGQATIAITAGVMPVSYSWSSGETTATAINLVTGHNSVEITDGNGCTETKELYVPCADLYRPCDDGNVYTQGDHIDESCNCVGEEVMCSDDLLPTNVAHGKATTQSSTISGAIASRAVDGNPDGTWSNSSVTHTDKEDNAWWELDLEQVYDVSALVIWNRTDCCQRRLDSFYVFTSEVPFKSTDLSATIADPDVSGELYPDAPLSNLVLKPTMPLRYVRIQLAHNDRLNLAEVEVFVCGEVEAEIVTANPLDDNRWEVKGTILRQGREITDIQLEYGEGDFSNAITIDIEDINTQDVFKVIEVADVGIASNQQFRIKVSAGAKLYYSNIYTVATDQTYCIPVSGNSFWYKRFSRVTYDGDTYADGGNINYEDTTEVHWGVLEMGNSYEFTMSTPSSEWTNLYYVVYADLNNDGDFDDYNEVLGSASPMGQTTPVSIIIPHQDVVVDIDLRMRILGHEGGDIGPCYTPVGNYKDFSITVASGDCQGTGYIDLRYADTDGDGYGDPDKIAMANCNDEAYSTDNTDFDDNEITAFPGAPELCDGIDNDGNSSVDDNINLGEEVLQLQSEVLSTGIYTAASMITTADNVEGAAGAKVRFYAGETVELGPLFEIPSGSEFFIFIQDECIPTAATSSQASSK